MRYIYQHSNWPTFSWDYEALLSTLGKVRNLEGQLKGQMTNLGFKLKDEANLETVTLDVLKSTEIEGEFLNPEQVRSSVARHLGLKISGLVPSDRNVDGVVEMMLDALTRHELPLTKERLFNWHSSLFPAGRNGMYKIVIGNWRDDVTGPMQVVSGAMGKEKVHFEAQAAIFLDQEMEKFISWFNAKDLLDPVLRAAIAHFWFVTIHPFDDGNGRIARAIADMQLSKADDSTQRFYSMSAQIRVERKQYYEILERTQKGNLDITEWLLWFLNCLSNSLNASKQTLSKVLFKAQFWKTHAIASLNERQRLLTNKVLDGFDGKLTTSKYAKISKCSADTALRDIQDLINKEVLQKEKGGGRSTSYELKQIDVNQ